MEQRPPDYLMIFLSVIAMILAAFIGIMLLNACSISYHKEFAEIEGKQAGTTDFTITTKS